MNKIINIRFLNRKQNSAVWFLSFVAIALVLLRVKITHSVYLLFLIWNLFLAIIPYILSSSIYSNFFHYNKKILNYTLGIIWFLLIPNSFYILTDFTHLYFKNTFQFVLDTLILTSFSLAGFYVGLHSVHQIHQLAIAKHGNKTGKFFIICISFLSAFGIYLGRFLRFNSWDILTKPYELIYHSVLAILNLETFVFTLQLGIVILVSYIIFNNRKQKNIKY